MATFDAQVIHDKAEGGKVIDWNAKMTIKTLDAGHMQVLAKTGADAWDVYNYITLDYYKTH